MGAIRDLLVAVGFVALINILVGDLAAAVALSFIIWLFLLVGMRVLVYYGEVPDATV